MLVNSHVDLNDGVAPLLAHYLKSINIFKFNYLLKVYTNIVYGFIKNTMSDLSLRCIGIQRAATGIGFINLIYNIFRVERVQNRTYHIFRLQNVQNRTIYNISRLREIQNGLISSCECQN